VTPLTQILLGAILGALAGLLLWRWLRTGAHRRANDQPHLTLTGAWAVVPMAAGGGAIAGTVAGWVALPAWVYLVGGALVVWIDLDVHRIPDQVLKAWVPVLGGAIIAAAVGEESWALLGGAVTGTLSLGAMFLLLALVGSMGLGDVKLAAATGLLVGVMGWASVGTTVVACFLTAGTVAAWKLTRGASRSQHLAFGPAIIFGAAVAVLRFGMGV